MIAQHFEFKDWEKAFDLFNKFGAETVQLVVSTHPYSSGYWIERKGLQVYDSLDFVYVDDEVSALKERVKNRDPFKSGVIL